MSIAVQATGDNEFTITLGETFDFSCMEEFQHAYESVRSDTESGKQSFVIDLRRTHYIDSSALGMLINMHKFWQHSLDVIRIINSNPQIKKIFAISRFDKKFTIE